MDENDEPAGGRGELWTRPYNMRSDARMAARLLSLGCISEEQAQSLIRKGMALAAKCGDNNPRGYAACMKILIECVKLEQREEELRLGNVEQHLHLHATANGRSTAAPIIEPAPIADAEYLEFIRDRLAKNNGLPGVPCEPCDREPLGVGEPSAVPRPAAGEPRSTPAKSNGHANGNRRNGHH